jgi:hypothetical protein
MHYKALINRPRAVLYIREWDQVLIADHDAQRIRLVTLIDRRIWTWMGDGYRCATAFCANRLDGVLSMAYSPRMWRDPVLELTFAEEGKVKDVDPEAADGAKGALRSVYLGNASQCLGGELPHGVVHHATQGEAANVTCDDGYEPRGTVVCDTPIKVAYTKHAGKDVEHRGVGRRVEVFSHPAASSEFMGHLDSCLLQCWLDESCRFVRYRHSFGPVAVPDSRKECVHFFDKTLEAMVRDEDVRIMVLPWADLYEVGDGNPPYFGRYPVRNTAWTPWVPDCIPIEGPKFVDVYPAEGVKGYTAMPEGNWNSAIPGWLDIVLTFDEPIAVGPNPVPDYELPAGAFHLMEYEVGDGNAGYLGNSVQTEIFLPQAAITGENEVSLRLTPLKPNKAYELYFFAGAVQDKRTPPGQSALVRYTFTTCPELELLERVPPEEDFVTGLLTLRYSLPVEIQEWRWYRGAGSTQRLDWEWTAGARDTSAVTVGDSVVLETPATPGEYTLRGTVRDMYGQTLEIRTTLAVDGWTDPPPPPPPVLREPQFKYAHPAPGTEFPYGAPVPPVWFDYDLPIALGRDTMLASVVVTSTTLIADPPVIFEREYKFDDPDIRTIGNQVHIWAADVVAKIPWAKGSTTGVRSVQIRIPNGFLRSFEDGPAGAGETFFTFGQQHVRLLSGVSGYASWTGTEHRAFVSVKLDREATVSCSLVPPAFVDLARLPQIRTLLTGYMPPYPTNQTRAVNVSSLDDSCPRCGWGRSGEFQADIQFGGLPHKDEFFPICFARGVPDEQIVRAVRETRPFRTGIHTARQIEDLRVGDDCSMELAEGTYTQCFMEAPQALHLTAPDTSVVHVRSVTALTEGVTIQERETRMREKSHQPHNVSVGVNVSYEPALLGRTDPVFGRDSQLFAASWGAVSVHTTNDEGPARAFAFDLTYAGAADVVITHIISHPDFAYNPSTQDNTFFDVTRRVVQTGETLRMILRIRGHPDVFRVLRTRGALFDIYLGPFPQEVIKVTPVDTMIPFIQRTPTDVFGDHEGFQVDFKVNCFIQELPMIVKFGGMFVRNLSPIKSFFFTDLVFEVNSVKITVQKEIPLRDNSDGSDADKKDPAVLVVKGVGFATKHYRELVRLWAVPRLAEPFSPECTLDRVEDMWARARIQDMTTRLNTSSLALPPAYLDYGRDPLSEACELSAINNLCKHTWWRSTLELACELDHAVGEEVDVRVQVYTVWSGTYQIPVERIRLDDAPDLDITNKRYTTFSGSFGTGDLWMRFVPEGEEIMYEPVTLADHRGTGGDKGLRTTAVPVGLNLCEVLEVTQFRLDCELRPLHLLKLELLGVSTRGTLVVTQNQQTASASVTLVFPPPHIDSITVDGVLGKEVDDVCCHNITLRGDYFGTVAHGPPTVHLDETPCSVWYRDVYAIHCVLGTRVDNDAGAADWAGEARRLTVRLAGQEDTAPIILRRAFCRPGERRVSRDTRDCQPCEMWTHSPVSQSSTQCAPCGTALEEGMIDCPPCPERAVFSQSTQRCECTVPFAEAVTGPAGAETCAYPPRWGLSSGASQPSVVSRPGGWIWPAEDHQAVSIDSPAFEARVRECRFGADACAGNNECVEGYAADGCTECDVTHRWDMVACVPRCWEGKLETFTTCSAGSAVLAMLVYVFGITLALASPRIYMSEAPRMLRKLVSSEEAAMLVPVLVHHAFHVAQTLVLITRWQRGMTRWHRIEDFARAFGFDWEVLLAVDRERSVFGPVAWVACALLAGFYLAWKRRPGARFATGRAVGVMLRLNSPYLLASAFAPQEGNATFSPFAAFAGLVAFFLAATPLFQITVGAKLPKKLGELVNGIQYGAANDSFAGHTTRASVWGAFMVGRRMIFAAVLPLFEGGLVTSLVVQVVSLMFVHFAYFHPVLRLSVGVAELAVTAELVLALMGYRAYGTLTFGGVVGLLFVFALMACCLGGRPRKGEKPSLLARCCGSVFQVASRPEDYQELASGSRPGSAQRPLQATPAKGTASPYAESGVHDMTVEDVSPYKSPERTRAPEPARLPTPPEGKRAIPPAPSRLPEARASTPVDAMGTTQETFASTRLPTPPERLNTPASHPSRLSTPDERSGLLADRGLFADPDQTIGGNTTELIRSIGTIAREVLTGEVPDPGLDRAWPSERTGDDFSLSPSVSPEERLAPDLRASLEPVEVPPLEPSRLRPLTPGEVPEDPSGPLLDRDGPRSGV